ncbi:MAG: IS200/IS605 family transposase [Acidobacteria bacterium]|nr:IS200/IS605 family transposase [Acidobacteriota bacterium]
MVRHDVIRPEGLDRYSEHFQTRVLCKFPDFDDLARKQFRLAPRQICATNDVSIIRGPISRDHMHLFVSVPPKVTVSRLLQFLKGKTSCKLMQEFPHRAKKFWERHLWARGYFWVSSGNVTDEVIKVEGEED